MRNSATADRQAPRLGLIGSLAFHAGIISVVFFTWTHKLDIVDQSAPVVPVDLVTFADKTVEYRTVDELKAAIREVQADLHRQAVDTGLWPQAPRQIRVTTGKGF